jgi:hypothetical protein
MFAWSSERGGTVQPYPDDTAGESNHITTYADIPGIGQIQAQEARILDQMINDLVEEEEEDRDDANADADAGDGANANTGSGSDSDSDTEMAQQVTNRRQRRVHILQKYEKYYQYAVLHVCDVNFVDVVCKRCQDGGVLPMKVTDSVDGVGPKQGHRRAPIFHVEAHAV